MSDPGKERTSEIVRRRQLCAIKFEVDPGYICVRDIMQGGRTRALQEKMLVVSAAMRSLDPILEGLSGCTLERSARLFSKRFHTYIIVVWHASEEWKEWKELKELKELKEELKDADSFTDDIKWSAKHLARNVQSLLSNVVVLLTPLPSS